MLFVGREFSVFGGRSPAALRRARNSNMRTLIARRPVARQSSDRYAVVAPVASAVAFNAIVRPTILLPVLLVNPSTSGLFCARCAATTCPTLLDFERRMESRRSINMIPGRTEISASTAIENTSKVGSKGTFNSKRVFK
jgi:hypothetical protein